MDTPFEDVVARYGERVFRVCRMVVGPVDADDAWSETFLAALRAWPALEKDANVEAWLVTIAHRKSIDFLRAAKRRPQPLGDTGDLAGASPDREPEAFSVPRIGGVQIERWQWPPVPDGTFAVWDVVARLPEKQRQVIAYRYLGGLRYADIAAIVGGSTEAARRAAADGIAKLRTLVHAPAAGEDEDEPLEGVA